MASVDSMRAPRAGPWVGIARATVGASLKVAALCGEPEELGHCLVNDLQAPALRLRPELAETIAAARHAGALAVTLSGSGPTVAALARDAAHAQALAATLRDAPTVARAIPTHGPVCGARIESTEAI